MTKKVIFINQSGVTVPLNLEDKTTLLWKSIPIFKKMLTQT